ncbi:MAG TPA: putative Ig domain-containing protein [Acidobacteriaceae bacterium]|jgi:DNA-binding beta-propeller fold protein YncE|nr:putative Ig domain-containing protein [Acidobacteriaceae bacterium]
MHSFRWAFLSLAAVVLSLGGCSGSGSHAPAAPTYAAAAPVYTRGVAITPDAPASGSSATNWSISPVLPAGLSLSPGSGIVSGTPTVVAATASYTVTAAGLGGSATTTLSITVNDQAPSQFSYAAGTAVYVVNTPVTPNSPSIAGGTVLAYSVNPALPSGLGLAPSTGIISGAPAVVSPASTYTVTATNSGGSATATLNITVNAAPNPAGPAAPAGLAYSPGNAIYTAGTPIPQNVPTSTGGAPTAWSISPALPAGLHLNAAIPSIAPVSGIIAGTPSATALPTLYTVTASNAAGSATASFTLSVDAADISPAGLAYSAPAPVYTAGVPITPDVPLTSPHGGAPTSFNVTPDLPPGLTLDSNSGIVSGTPQAVPSTIVPPPPFRATWTVTASNSSGSTTAPLTITLYNAPQAITNLSQWITPLAIPGSSFQFLDTGLTVTDTANPQVAPVEWLAGQAVSTSVSPDGHTLLVLTSGYNRVFQGPFPLFDPAYSSEYVFVYDISGHAPVFQQAIPVPNAYHGIVWDPVPGNHAFYVSGGMGDAPWGTDPIPYPLPNNGDNIHIVTRQADGSWKSVAELDLGQTAGGVALGHPSGNGLPVPNNQPSTVNSAVFVAPMAAGLDISRDGQTLVVANYYNDSITVFTGGLSAWLSQWQPDPGSAQGGKGSLQGAELDLRPGMAAQSPAHGTPGGEYPFWVVLAGDSGSGATAYVSSLRDREIDVVKLGEACAPGTSGSGCLLAAAPVVAARIPVKGQPNKMTLNQAQTLLYVAEDESDTVDVIDLNPADAGTPGQNRPATVNTVIETIPVIAPAAALQAFNLAQYTGANTNSVTLSPDEKYLYVTNGNLNNIAVVLLTGTNSGDQTIGLIPAGWYPNSLSFSQDGTWAYVVNSKSPTGPNPDWCYNYGPAGYFSCAPANEYNPQQTKAGLLSFPVAGALAQLPALTAEVATNNHFGSTPQESSVIAAVHQGVLHVIYILKENRTYDQILGDLGRGNGDPALAMFGQAVTPNQHNLAQNFVTLDNFFDSAEVSNDGWPWSTSARAPDVVEHQYPVNYAQRGVSLDTEGDNRGVDIALPTLAQRQAEDPLMPGGALSPGVEGGEDLLPGQTDVDAPDGPNDELNTGYLWDDALRAGLTVRNYGFFIDTTCYNQPSCQTPLAQNPFATHTVVAPSASVSLSPLTDPYFRGFDPAFPDYYRFKEWERDFDTNFAAGGLPNLTLIRFMHDHTGSFATAIDGVNTPDRQVADNDYAVGLVVQKIANSPIYKNNTLIFVIEDDAQDGGDHVDSHRSTAYIAGAWVRNALVSTHYTTLDFVRTMEAVLGLPAMNLNDALASPMADIFNDSPSPWSFTATPSTILYCTKLPLPGPALPCVNPTPDAAYWARVTLGMDFSDADRVDGGVFNRILWKGLMGNRPYPAAPSGLDLRSNRDRMLQNYRKSLPLKNATPPRPLRD